MKTLITDPIRHDFPMIIISITNWIANDAIELLWLIVLNESGAIYTT